MVSNFSVMLYAFMTYLLPVLFLSFFLNKSRLRQVGLLITKHPLKVIVVSVLIVLQYYTTLRAYQTSPIVIVYPIIQSATAVGVLCGTVLFEDGKAWKQKLLAATVSIAGALLIKFY